MKKKRKQQQQQQIKDRKEQGETEAIVKGWEVNDFVFHLSSAFFQLICKASLIFKSKLELDLPIILKQR